MSIDQVMVEIGEGAVERADTAGGGASARAISDTSDGAMSASRCRSHKDICGSALPLKGGEPAMNRPSKWLTNRSAGGALWKKFGHASGSLRSGAGMATCVKADDRAAPKQNIARVASPASPVRSTLANKVDLPLRRTLTFNCNSPAAGPTNAICAERSGGTAPNSLRAACMH